MISMRSMMAGGLFLAALAVAGAYRGPSASLKNPRFEDGLSGWELHAPEPSRITPGGEGSARIEMPSGTRLPNLRQRLSGLEPGATYRLSAAVRSVKGEPSAKLVLDFYDRGGRGLSSHPLVRDLPAPGGWVEVAVTAEADEEAALADATLGAAAPGTLEVGKVRFEKIASAPDLRLLPEGGPLVVEPHQGAPVSLLAFLKEPQGGTRPPFEVWLEGLERPLPSNARRIGPHAWKIDVKLPPLPPGEKRLSVSLDTLGAETAFFVNAERRKPERLDAQGVHLWRGEPFFPIGLYHVAHTDAEYAMLAESGFNMIQGVFPGNLDDFMKSLDLALNHGIAVDVPLYAGGRVKENLARSREVIRRARNHPAVLCWKILDEPDADRNAPRRPEIAPVYAALKEERPPQPLELTLCQDEPLPYWMNFCDVAQIDRYPLPGGKLTEVYDACVKAKAAARPWQSITAVLQCGWTADLKTQPSPEEARAMVYLSLIAGAKGISWYSRSDPGWDLTRTPLWPRLKEINREVRSLSRPLLLGRELPGVTCDAPAVRFRAVLFEGMLRLLVCNPGSTPVAARFFLPAPRGGGVWKALAEKGGGELCLNLRPLDSRTMLFKKEGGTP